MFAHAMATTSSTVARNRGYVDAYACAWIWRSGVTLVFQVGAKPLRRAMRTRRGLHGPGQRVYACHGLDRSEAPRRHFGRCHQRGALWLAQVRRPRRLDHHETVEVRIRERREVDRVHDAEHGHARAKPE